LVCEDAVISTLKDHKSTLKTSIEELAKFVCHGGKRLFAILVWSEAEVLIERFYHHRFGDQQLPVEVNINDDDEDTVDAFSFKFGRLNLINDHPFNSPPWSDRELENFCDNYQWPFLSPVFYEHQFQYQLHEKSRMPFMEQKARSRKETYFSVVEEWCIHRGHLQIGRSIGIPESSDKHPCVAIKELKQMSMTDEEFKAVVASEAEILEMLRQLNHTHLIRAIAYYTKGEKHFVMFPWAQGGNLRDFWKKDPPTLTPEYLQWAFSQLTGLAEAIMKLHHSHTDQHWRHGDLKPENILCFEEGDSCTLVIADVGLSKGHESLTEARRDKTHTKAGTIMYEPPESEILADKPRSRRYDIWSIGCIYLEFVVWLLYGTKGLRRVREELDSTAVDGNVRFYVIDSSQKTFTLNNVIQKWIEHIWSDPRCPKDTGVGRLVDLIVTRLLVAVGTEDEYGSRRRQQRVDSFISRTDSETGEPSTPFLLLSPATYRSGTADDPFFRDRATAKEMHREMMAILEDSASGPSQEWMKWNEPFQEAPGQYAKNLAVSDAISATVRSNKEQEVQEVR
jgi:serine/threonine protein kinase